MDNIAELKKLAKNIRMDVLKMTYDKKAGFIGSSFSCADILAVLYGYVMKYDSKNMDKEGTDVFFLSKGHAASAWYAVLSNVGIIVTVIPLSTTSHPDSVNTRMISSIPTDSFICL